MIRGLTSNLTCCRKARCSSGQVRRLVQQLSSSLDRPDRCGAFLKNLGLFHPVGCSIQLRQILKALGHIGMIRAEGLLPDRQRTLEERLGLRVLALGLPAKLFHLTFIFRRERFVPA